jgi:hypothetical protein
MPRAIPADSISSEGRVDGNNIKENCNGDDGGDCSGLPDTRRSQRLQSGALSSRVED